MDEVCQAGHTGDVGSISELYNIFLLSDIRRLDKNGSRQDKCRDLVLLGIFFKIQTEP